MLVNRLCAGLEEAHLEANVCIAGVVAPCRLDSDVQRALACRSRHSSVLSVGRSRSAENRRQQQCNKEYATCHRYYLVCLLNKLLLFRLAAITTAPSATTASATVCVGNSGV